VLVGIELIIVQILAGTIIYNSQDIGTTLRDFNAGYQKLAAEGMPPELNVQQMVVNAPPGRMFGIGFMWSSEDGEKGRLWCKKFETLGSVIMSNVEITTIPNWYKANAAMVPHSAYGTSRTHSLRTMSTEATAVIGRNLENMPSNPATMLSIHELRGLSSVPDAGSVFGTREPHYMLEILGMATTEDVKEESARWAFNVWKSLQEQSGDSILPGSYVSLDLPDQNSTLSKYFGINGQKVLELKEKYDPENVFALAVPALK
jgi:hypothetical protein